MKLLILLLTAGAVLAVDETNSIANNNIEDSSQLPRAAIPPDNYNCQIHYECKHYKWFCYRSEYAFCIDNTCQCYPRYHFGYRHPYHRP